MMKQSQSTLKCKKVIIVALVCAFVALMCLSGRIDARGLYKYFDDYSYVHPYLVVLLFFLVQVGVILVGIFPASVSVVGAGVVFGVVEGFALASLFVLFGSVVAFGLSRSVLRQFILRLWGQNPLFHVLEETISEKGWRAVCLLRLSPILPFAITNYAVGLTKVSFRDYFLGTLFSLPPLLGYVLIGALTRNDINGSVKGSITGIKLALDGVYLVTTVFLVWYTGKLLCKHMKKAS